MRPETGGKGHRWIADDAIEIERRGDLLHGRSNELVKGLIDIKHRGIIEAEELSTPSHSRRFSHKSLVEFVSESSPAASMRTIIRDSRGQTALCGDPRFSADAQFMETC